MAAGKTAVCHAASFHDYIDIYGLTWKILDIYKLTKSRFFLALHRPSAYLERQIAVPC